MWLSIIVLAVVAVGVLVILNSRASRRRDGQEADYDDRENDWGPPGGDDYAPEPPRTRPSSCWRLGPARRSRC
jgi:hypothetical protein